MNLDFDSGKKLHNYVEDYAKIYAQFDKDALAKEQLKIDQQKVGMLQQQFATEQADNVSKLKAQGMLADNPNIGVAEIASVHLPTATALQNIRSSQLSSKTLTADKFKRGVDRVLGINRESLQGTVGKNYLDGVINSYYGGETTGTFFKDPLIPDDLDTSSLDSVLNFFNRNQAKLGLAKGAYNDTRKEIIEGYEQALREGARSLAYGDNKTTAPPSGKQDSNRTNPSAEVFGVSQQSPLLPVGTSNQQPSTSLSPATEVMRAISNKLSSMTHLAQVKAFQREVAKAQNNRSDVTPQQSAQVNKMFMDKLTSLGQ